MTTELFAKVQRIAADLFQVPLEQITTRSTSEDIATWDSVQQLNFVLALEQEFGLQLDPEEMAQAQSIAGILELLRVKLGSSS